MRDLGAGPEAESFASDVDSRRQVVGTSLTMGVRAIATPWDPDLGFIDLNDVVVGLGERTLDEAVAIDDRGQIAANGILRGARLGVLLTPIPEPGTALLLGLGVARMASRRRRPSPFHARPARR